MKVAGQGVWCLFSRRSTRQRKDVDDNEAHNLVSLDDVKLRGSKVDRVSERVQQMLLYETFADKI